MLALFKKRKSAGSSSPPSAESSVTRSGLRPLHLVEELLAAGVIDPPKPTPALQVSERKKKTRPSIGASQSSRRSVVHQRAPFVVPLHFNARKTPRISSPHKPQRGPCRTTKQTLPRPVRSSKENIRKTNWPAPSHIPRFSTGSFIPRANVPVKSPKKTASPRSRIPVVVDRRSPVAPTPARATRPPRSVRCHIPVFVGPRLATYTRTAFQPARRPRTTPSRIPRLKYAASQPSSSTYSESGTTRSPPSSSCEDSIFDEYSFLSEDSIFSNDSNFSYSPETPCPSHTLVVVARQLAVKASATEATAVSESACAVCVVCEKEDEKEENPARDVAVVPSATQALDTLSFEPISVDVSRRLPMGVPQKKEASSEPVADISSVGPKDERTHDTKVAAISDPTNALPLSSSGNAGIVSCLASSGPRSDPNPKASLKANEDNSTGALMGEFKTRLSWSKKPTVATGINKSECSRSDINDQTSASSELQLVLALRRAAITRPSSNFDVKPHTQEPRRPLAPIPGFVNGAFTGHDDSKSVSAPTSIPTEDTMNSDDCNPPGAEFTLTKLLTTPFGTRRVRRMVVPPLQEGALPSKDPRIVAELKFLRAKQKVGGGAKTAEGA